MAAKSLPSQSYLRECFDYDPDTGVLRWRTRPLEHFKTAREWRRWNTRYARREARSLNRSGYYTLCIDYESYLTARIIYKLIHGLDPIQIDHRNTHPTDDRLDNLRNATHAQNAQHRRHPNATGCKGVRQKSARCFEARISLDGRVTSLGYFQTADAAYATYCAAARQHFGEFWHF